MAKRYYVIICRITQRTHLLFYNYWLELKLHDMVVDDTSIISLSQPLPDYSYLGCDIICYIWILLLLFFSYLLRVNSRAMFNPPLYYVPGDDT